jgi:hypothetical protein
MSVQQWGIVVGVMMSVLLALTPWMFMVHAKLAVIATQVTELAEKVEKATDANSRLWDRYARHDTLLQTHEVHFAHLAERLEEL